MIGGDPSAVTCVYSLIAALEKGMVFIQRLGERGDISAMIDLYKDIGGK